MKPYVSKRKREENKKCVEITVREDPAAAVKTTADAAAHVCPASSAEAADTAAKCKAN